MSGGPGVTAGTGDGGVDDAGDAAAEVGADLDAVGGGHVIACGGAELGGFGALVVSLVSSSGVQIQAVGSPR